MLLYGTTMMVRMSEHDEKNTKEKLSVNVYVQIRIYTYINKSLTN